MRLAPLWIAFALLAPAPVRAQTLLDPNLAIQTVATGLSQPTTMAFVGPNDILVLEKQSGLVLRVLDGVLQPDEALAVPVNFTSERGLLGIAVTTAQSTVRVFLYYTEATGLGGTAFGNRVYRYDWNPTSGTLQSPVLVLDLPVTTGPNHNGGIILFGPDGFLYTVIGDLNRSGQLQNIKTGPAPDDTGVILRTLENGSAAPGNPFTPYCSSTTTTTCTTNGDCPGSETCVVKVARYFAYGVRNCFGMAIDPATGALWDTENGPSNYDEVNRIAPGTNSGWTQIMGPDARDAQSPADLFDMPGAGSTYSDPEFSWLSTIAPTSIVFPVGSLLGDAYDDMALVGDNNFGQLYAFPLNAARTALAVTSLPGLSDLVADSTSERDQLRIGSGFGVITDLEVGPDRALYVVSLNQGAIYRISGPAPVPGLGTAALVALAVGLLAAAGVVKSSGRASF